MKLGFAVLILAGGVAQAQPGHIATEIDVAHRDVPLPVHVWYPTDQRDPVTRLGGNAVFVGAPVVEDAQSLGDPAPVVLVSHGSGGNAANLGWLANALTDRGVIVVAPNHPGTTSGDSLPQRTVMPWERADDLGAILDWLKRAPPEGLSPDLDRVGVLGFSLGGHTALRVAGARVSKSAFIAYCEGNIGLECQWLADGGADLTAIDATRYEADDRDARIEAVIAVDPALAQAYTAESLGRIDVPVLLINLGDPETIPAGVDAAAIAPTIPGARHLYVSGASHFSFLGRCTWLGWAVVGLSGEDPICADPGPRARADIQAEIATAAGAFLSDVLAR
ncbi:hypothetical protein OCGS_0388 [Oceaniovalibus guishaninsula JLT2003]|uniref:Xaa-Pro dipeptidyl-peptidase-like domain-containing protein n=1 Tax=Oceaniovalibus guishaninsula JLT2003 TaxID=1231392 RepID=K2HCZ2_9RHOB|nr:CocE/NonD family hydrolase [Oceaniovalibus guishaninsula]EKE45298.1 hypothetical protein OCGS_0388 [Oceaniovalibus guishaninsula JLT2003]